MQINELNLERDLAFDRSKVVDGNIFDPAFKRRPTETFMEWATKTPFYMLFGGWPQAVATRHEDVKRAFGDHEYFSSVKRPWRGIEKFYYFQGLPVVTDNDPPNQARLRRLMAPAFSPRRLAAIETDLAVYVAARLDALEAGDGRFDAVTDLGRPLSAQVLFGMLLGLPEEDWGVFLRIAHLFSVFNNMKAGDKPPAEFLQAWAEGRAYCEKLIEDRRRHPQDDVVGHIVAAHDAEGKITVDEMFATLFVMYVAGQGGVANTPAWALWRLCRHRDQLELLQREPELLSNAVDEGIRTDPNAYMLLRHATRDFEFSGLQLYKDMPVLIIPGAPNYDPTRYEDPLKFDITRKPQKDIMSFGYGVHHCIGEALARMAGRVTVGAVVKRFPKLRLEDPDLWPEILGGPKERGPVSIPLRFD